MCPRDPLVPSLARIAIGPVGLQPRQMKRVLRIKRPSCWLGLQVSMGLKLCLHQPCDHITDISAARQFMQGLLQTSAASVLLQVQPCRATEPVTQRLALEGEYPTRLWRSSLSLRAVSLGHWKALLGRTLDREAFITSLRANPDSLGRIITDPLTQTCFHPLGQPVVV